MSCPTCDHTMQGVGENWFWCPRCGTLKERQGVIVDVPSGVGQARNWLLQKSVTEDHARSVLCEMFLSPDEREVVGGEK